MDFSDLCLEPGFHLGVSGSRYLPTRQATDSLRFCIDQLQTLGARYLHHGCCTGWDAWSIPYAKKAGLWIVGHPPVKEKFLSRRAMQESNDLWPRKPYEARDRDIAFETVVLITGPRFPETDPRSAHSGTWLTTRYARLYGSRVYACTTTGEIEDVTERHDST